MKIRTTQSNGEGGAVEYADCISAEGVRPPLN